MTYYTLQIQYGSSIKQENFEIKDLEFVPEAGLPEFQWRQNIQRRIYTIGFTIETAKGTWEFISPLRIHTAYLIRQAQKFGV